MKLVVGALSVGLHARDLILKQSDNGFENLFQEIPKLPVFLKNGSSKENHIRSMLFHRINEDIGLVGYDVDYDQVMSYGCWCNFDEKRKPKGIPRDGIDQICHKWAQCNKCIGMDQICDEDIEIENEYNIKITKYDNSFTCNMNEDKCSQSKCLCDSFLIDQLIEELKREGFHPEYAHANDFDYTSQCAIGTDFARSHSQENTPDQCCGNYPTRFPFMSKDGIHKCCGSKIFNPEYKECCEDGLIRGIGECQTIAVEKMTCDKLDCGIMSKCKEEINGPVCLPLPGLSQTFERSRNDPPSFELRMNSTLELTGIAEVDKSPQKKGHCSTIKCLNGGKCNEDIDMIPCACTDDFMGVYCEIAICKRNTTVTDEGDDQLEVIFAIDRSGSMTAPIFKIAKEYVYSVILGLQTQYFIKIGVVSFAADARLDLPMDYYDTSNITSNTVRDAIGQMKYTGGYTSLGLIIGMVSQLYDFKNINSRKVLVLITDGWSADDFTLATNAMGQAGVSIIPIGLNNDFNLKYDALKMLSLFDSSRVMKSTDWDNVARLRHDLMNKICEADPVVTMERARNIELPKLDEDFLRLSKVNDLQGFFQEKYTLSELKDMLEQS